MKEVSSRPMGQGRLLWVMAVNCAGVTVNLYTSKCREEFGPDMGCVCRKEKARLFRLSELRGGLLEGCTLGPNSL